MARKTKKHIVQHHGEKETVIERPAPQYVPTEIDIRASSVDRALQLRSFGESTDVAGVLSNAGKISDFILGIETLDTEGESTGFYVPEAEAYPTPHAHFEAAAEQVSLGNYDLGWNAAIDALLAEGAGYRDEAQVTAGDVRRFAEGLRR